MLARSRIFASAALTVSAFLTLAAFAAEAPSSKPAAAPAPTAPAATVPAAAAPAKTVRVSSNAELQSALSAAVPGTRIEIAAGDYSGGLSFTGLRGEKDRPIVLAGADPEKPPKFTGGTTGLHLVNPAFVELHHLAFTGAKANGVSLDDGGRYAPEPRGIVLLGLRISEVGPRGNNDGLKLSGIIGFRVEDCVIENWGIGSGSAIDMVGCHDGLITGCTFRHHEALQETGGTGVQMKGGSSDIVVRRNRFENAGTRAVNLGGSTGAAYFRPPLDQWPAGLPRAEARKLTVEGNTFIGSLSPFACVGVDGAVIRCNTIYRPTKWVVRFLQENKAPEFVPTRGVEFSDNLIAYASTGWSENGVNLGIPVTAGTVRFARNHWYCLDRPDRSQPKLPTPEEGGTSGTDPQFEDVGKLDLRLKAGSAVKGKGAEGLPK
jgi:hypothetical protein